MKINHLQTQIVKSLNSFDLYPILGSRHTGTLGSLGKPKLGRGVFELQVPREKSFYPEGKYYYFYLVSKETKFERG